MKKFVFFALFALLIFAFFASVAYAELEIEGLEVAGSEGIFYPVTYAYFEWETRVLRVRSEFVHDPCEVRYGWGDFNPGNLKNAEGLPVSPFWLKMEK